MSASSAHGGGDLWKPALFWELYCCVKAGFEPIYPAFSLNEMVLFTSSILGALLSIEEWKTQKYPLIYTISPAW